MLIWALLALKPWKNSYWSVFNKWLLSWGWHQKENQESNSCCVHRDEHRNIVEWHQCMCQHLLMFCHYIMCVDRKTVLKTKKPQVLSTIIHNIQRNTVDRVCSVHQTNAVHPTVLQYILCFCWDGFKDLLLYCNYYVAWCENNVTALILHSYKCKEQTYWNK